MSSNTNSSSSIPSKCAACGKGGDNLKVCTSCEQVSYCNAKCKKAHRSKHKKECRQLAAERHNSEAIMSIDTHVIIEKFSKMEISDEELFADPPPRDDCDICFLPMPYTRASCGVTTVYQPCCGKILCYGCVSAAKSEMIKGSLKRCCPFCTVPLSITNGEQIERVKKRMELNDANAFHELAGWYYHGNTGLEQDLRKAFELFNRGAELGSVSSHCLLAKMYQFGRGVEKDEEKSKHHLILAAMGGDEVARHMLGDIEHYNGDIDRAMKHYMMAAKCGYDDALKEIGLGYKAGKVTKDEYASTLRAHRASQDEMKSEQRTKAGTK